MSERPILQAPMPVSCVTPPNDLRRGWGTASTYSTALSSISAKADVYNSGPPVVSTPTTGLCLHTRPAGSVFLATVIGKANNGTMTVRLWSWKRIVSGDTFQWTARPLALLAVTLGAKTGVAGGIVDATTCYADTIVVTTDYGPPPLGVRVIAGPSADDSTVYVEIDATNSDYIEFEGTISGGSATEFDFLFCGVSGV